MLTTTTRAVTSGQELAGYLTVGGTGQPAPGQHKAITACPGGLRPRPQQAAALTPCAAAASCASCACACAAPSRPSSPSSLPAGPALFSLSAACAAARPPPRRLPLRCCCRCRCCYQRSRLTRRIPLHRWAAPALPPSGMLWLAPAAGGRGGGGGGGVHYKNLTSTEPTGLMGQKRRGLASRLSAAHASRQAG